MQVSLYVNPSEKKVIEEIDKILDIEDKYGNKKFNNRNEAIFHLLKIGIYHFFKESEFKEKRVYDEK